MSIRTQNLESIAPILVSFSIHQTAGVDDLKDEDIGCAVGLTNGLEVGPLANDQQLLGKLVGLSLSDADTGKRLATVQVGGVCRLAIASPYPVMGNRVSGAGNGTVKQAAAVASDPAGGNIARGTVLDVNGTIDCTLLLN